MCVYIYTFFDMYVFILWCKDVYCIMIKMSSFILQKLMQHKRWHRHQHGRQHAEQQNEVIIIIP
jgi:hypothetical protein